MREKEKSGSAGVPVMKNSNLRGLNVLFLHPNSEICDEFEARAEQEITRINFYSASSLSVARDLIKLHHCQLAIFPDGMEGKDFVFTQLELRNVDRSILMIPLIDVPTIEQLSAQRKIGGIHTFGKKEEANSFAAITRMIMNFARDLAKNHPGIEEHLEYGTTLQKVLFVRKPQELEIKKISTKILDGLLLKFDWNPNEVLRVLTAEMIYSPDVSTQSYASLLGIDTFQLGSWLSQTASWLQPNTKPGGAGGFSITLANYMAWKVSQATTVDSTIDAVFLRPHFLMHPSIRVLKKDELFELLNTAVAESEQNISRKQNVG